MVVACHRGNSMRFDSCHRVTPHLQYAPNPRYPSCSSVARELLSLLRGEIRLHAPSRTWLLIALVTLASSNATLVRAAGLPPSRFAADSVRRESIDCSDVRSGEVFELRAQRILLTGQRDTTWVPDSTSVCLGSVEGLPQRVVPDGDGGAFIGWVGSVEPDIHLHRVRADGTPAPGWPAGGRAVVAEPYSQYHLDMTPDGAGGLFLVWEDYRLGQGGDLYALRLDGAGEPVSGWPAGGIPVCSNPAEQSLPTIAADGHGGAFIVWQDRRSGSLELFAQHLDPAAGLAPGWPEGGRWYRGATSFDPTFVPGSAGSGLILWKRQNDAGSTELLGATLSSLDLTDPPAPTVIAAATEDLGQVGFAVAGDTALIGWAERRNGSEALRVQALDLTYGTPRWEAGPKAIDEGVIGRDPPAAMPDHAGGYVVAWDHLTEGVGRAMVQRLGSNAEIVSGWPEEGVPVTAGAGDQYGPRLSWDEDAVIATWRTSESKGAGTLLNMERMAELRSLELVEATAAPGRVRIRWKAHGPGTYRAYRRTPQGRWEEVATLIADRDGSLELTDRSVADGSRIEYRLAIELDGTAIVFEPVLVSVPFSPTALGLHGIRSRASESRIDFVLSLPRGPAPQVELMDVMGRRVLTRSLDDLEPGEHEVALQVPTRVVSGVYFLRLRQGDVRRAAKVVYVR